MIWMSSNFIVQALAKGGETDLLDTVDEASEDELVRIANVHEWLDVAEMSRKEGSRVLPSWMHLAIAACYVFEGRRRWPVRRRAAPDYRYAVEAMKSPDRRPSISFFDSKPRHYGVGAELKEFAERELEYGGPAARA